MGVGTLLSVGVSILLSVGVCILFLWGVSILLSVGGRSVGGRDTFVCE